MGNYTDIETEFIERTLRLIEQYNELIAELEFDEQLNYTLTINCLLGLIVMPKERLVTSISNELLSEAYLRDLGLEHSTIGEGITRFRELILQLRNSIAHFMIEVESETNEFLVDYLVFRHRNGNLVARIKANEIVPFLNFYCQNLLQNLRLRQNR
ncbi:HEPN family nuclease [Photobacterium swingsii]|uniref:HEPN family nuclease n=1 Tax=Photobacterium swingsii TaxID=680026 RepID=UPI004068F627